MRDKWLVYCVSSEENLFKEQLQFFLKKNNSDMPICTLRGLFVAVIIPP